MLRELSRCLRFQRQELDEVRYVKCIGESFRGQISGGKKKSDGESRIRYLKESVSSFDVIDYDDVDNKFLLYR